jgi:hypothetical protein
MNKRFKPPTPRQVKQALRSLERKGLIEKKRDAFGNVVTRPGKDGRPQVVWVATNVTPRALGIELEDRVEPMGAPGPRWSCAVRICRFGSAVRCELPGRYHSGHECVGHKGKAIVARRVQAGKPPMSASP